MLRPLLDFTLAVVLNNYLLTGGQDIKLVNGLDGCFGTVEVLNNGTWGTVCDDSWDIIDASVVCRQLGCGRAISAHGQALFGVGRGQVWMKSVDCLGSESFISNCSHAKVDCDHSNDAGVVCSASSVVIIGSVVTAVLLILSALLIVFLVKRRKKQKKIQICSCSKDAVNMQDVLQVVLQNQEDAEDDYEIVDMDDGDYEDVDSDSEQDYVNVDQDDSDQDYVNIETDDSEQDYVNITEQRSMLDNNYEDS